MINIHLLSTIYTYIIYIPINPYIHLRNLDP